VREHPLEVSRLLVGVEGPQDPALVLIAEIDGPGSGYSFLIAMPSISPFGFTHGQEQIPDA